MPDIQVNRQTVISFPNNQQLPSITTGIGSGSLQLDEVLCTDAFTIGQCNANRFEVDLYDIPDIEKQYIYVYQNVTEGNVTTVVPLFHGRVDSCKRNRSRNDTSRHIIAYDALYYLADIDVTKYWNDTFTSERTVTLDVFRKGLCDFVGLDYVDTALPNDNLLISKTQNINGVSFIEMLRYICALQACNANINREGKLEFLGAYSTYDITNNYEKNTSEFEAFTVPVFSQVYINNSIRDTEARAGTGKKIICIQDNLLVLDRTSAELEEIAQAILYSVAKISYNPANINMIVSDYDAKLGKIVQTDMGDHLVCETLLSGVQLIEQNIISRGKEDYEEQQTISGYQYSVTNEDLKSKQKILAEEYYLYNNESEIEVGDGQTKTIMDIQFTSIATTTVIFHAEVLVDVETTVNGITYNDAVGTIKYYINDAQVTDYIPKETWVDGKHILHLLYFMEIQGARTIRFEVTLNMAGGSLTIQQHGMQASIRGQGLLSSNEWDGYLYFRDTISEIPYKSATLEHNFTDAISTILDAPTEESLEDTIGEIQLRRIRVEKPIDTLLIDKDMMSAYTHGELHDVTHAQLNNRYIHG